MHRNCSLIVPQRNKLFHSRNIEYVSWTNPPWYVPTTVAPVKRRLTAVWSCWPQKVQLKFLWTFHKRIWPIRNLYCWLPMWYGVLGWSGLENFKDCSFWMDAGCFTWSFNDVAARFTRPRFSLQVPLNKTYHRILTCSQWQYRPPNRGPYSSGRKWLQPLALRIRDGELGQEYLKGQVQIIVF